MRCSVCGEAEFKSRDILWDRLINEWQLTQAETVYVNRQQGETCVTCGANLRSVALADAIRAARGTGELLGNFALSPEGRDVSILEINEAGSLSPRLRLFPKYLFGAYPEVDMHAIPYPDATFDLVIHSDTLEHVENPVHALQECRRVLKPGGALCFTVPIIVGRMTRNRAGLPPSYHGNPETSTDDLTVKHEFGADAWTYVMEAGFTSLAMHSVEYPCAIAFRATK
ncbi:ubiquinone/menaquinone biosynthesis methyltransferase [Caballeronia udeis]|uniref:Ubiquinone/menaquinone biosynthesis methyltransferase n=1 Tax=Caballeronia udeis TaxID=1232866 RepID=A0A158F2J0_9BURK|nr:class I SAM-dependent methyltransferase [Caballeronia udeis]SAL13853.1 ubiquinone/menaquinone biosynthesis methyltransferase [Caballeronia udeis]